MKKHLLAAALVAASTCACGYFASDAQAGTVLPYPNAGTPNSETYTFTASATGDIVAYFAGSTADYDEQVGMLVNGIPSGVIGLDDHTSSVGQSLDLGSVNAGDIITFFDVVFDISTTWYSNPALNSDGGNHVYSAAFDPLTTPGSYAAGLAFAGIPAGTYVAFEDLNFITGSDYNYFDDTFVFTDTGGTLITTSTTPLPATLPLFATGLGTLGLLGWRRKRKKATA